MPAGRKKKPPGKVAIVFSLVVFAALIPNGLTTVQAYELIA